MGDTPNPRQRQVPCTRNGENKSGAVSGAALTGDSAVDGPVPFDVWLGSTTAQSGTFTARADGTYTYQLDNTNATVNALSSTSPALSETFTQIAAAGHGAVTALAGTQGARGAGEDQLPGHTASVFQPAGTRSGAARESSQSTGASTSMGLSRRGSGT